MSVDSIISSCMSEIPKSLAAGVVDMSSGMLLGVKTVDSHPQEVLDLLAAATKELYEGDTMLAIESLFKRVRGIEGPEHFFQEFIATSTNVVHLFGRLKSSPSQVVGVVTRADANLGLALTKLRAICAEAKI